MDEGQRREFRNHTRLFLQNNHTILFQNRRIEDMEVNFVRQKLATDDKIKNIKIIDCYPDRAHLRGLMDILKNNKNVESFTYNRCIF